MLGMHYGTFDLTDEPLDEPPRRFQAEAQRRGLGSDRRVDAAARRDPALVSNY